MRAREGTEPGGRKPLSDHMLEWKKGGVSGRKEEDRKRRRGEYDVKRVYSESTTGSSSAAVYLIALAFDMCVAEMHQ